MKIVNYRLRKNNNEPYPFIQTPNKGGAITPEYLVMHYTNGRNAETTIDWFKQRRASASAHLIIGKDGDIFQLVAFNRRAWHAGGSKWAGRTGLNGFSIGIELDNPGALVRHTRGWFTTWGTPVDSYDVIEAVHKNGGPSRGWHAFTGVQLETAAQVAALLVRRYELKDVLGHDDVAPARKSDPGPAFPMDSFRGRVMGRAEDDPEVFETITNLNIRVGAGTQYDKLSVSPLPTGTQMDVVTRNGSWCLIDVLGEVNGESDIQGWVHGRYIRSS